MKESVSSCLPLQARELSMDLRDPSNGGFPFCTMGTSNAQVVGADLSLLSHHTLLFKKICAPNLSSKLALVRETKTLCYNATFWKTKGRFLTTNLSNS